MFRTLAATILVLALLLPAAPAAARVEPGVGIGGVRLGMTEAQAVAVRGEPTTARTIPDEIRGEVRELRWPGLRAILSEGSGISLVSTTSRRQRLAGGVGVGSTERALRRALRVRCATSFGRRRCTRGALVPGGRVTDFAIGPRSRRVAAITVAVVID